MAAKKSEVCKARSSLTPRLAFLKQDYGAWTVIVPEMTRLPSVPATNMV
jgi:hypothetical protein